MTIASFFRNAGLTLHAGSWKRTFEVFIPMEIVVVMTARMWPTSNISKVLVDFIRSNITDHVLHFTLFFLMILWYLLSMGYIICVTLTKPDGYPNSAPRAYTPQGAIFRAKSAAENTFESMGCCIVAVTICDKLATDDIQDLIASWAALVMVARTLYPVFYIIDIDLLRTFTFALSMFSYFFMCLVALFPEFQSYFKRTT